MDLGNLFRALFLSVWRIMSLRVSFSWLGSYFSFSLLQIMLGVLILSLGIVLIRKIISKD